MTTPTRRHYKRTGIPEILTLCAALLATVLVSAGQPSPWLDASASHAIQAH